MPPRKKTDQQPINFEQSLEELNTIVMKMEQGDLPLEESLKYFEHGVQLIRHCQKALKEAEQKVQILTKQPGGENLKPYEDHE